MLAARDMEANLLVRNAIGPIGYRLGLSDAAIARAAGLSRAHLNRIKNGSVTPRVDTAVAIARALGVPVRCVFRLRPAPHAR
jgi:transcriptional regulator with XRE-family HTH domain